MKLKELSTASAENIFESNIGNVYGTFVKHGNGYLMTTFGGVVLEYKSAEEGLLDWLDYLKVVYEDDHEVGDIQLIKYIESLKDVA